MTLMPITRQQTKPRMFRRKNRSMGPTRKMSLRSRTITITRKVIMPSIVPSQMTSFQWDDWLEKTRNSATTCFFYLIQELFLKELEKSASFTRFWK